MPSPYDPNQPPVSTSPYGAPPGAYAVGPNPAAPWGVHPVTGIPYSEKQKIVAGLLQIFLGSFGVGRFYTGHTGIAILQIVVVWFTCGAGALWPLIDGVMMLAGSVTDAEGRPLRD
jgi:TM2 domain-containing membrane protein YozV